MKLHNVFSDSNYHYLVLSLAQHDLDDVIAREGPLNERAIQFFGAQIFAGLEFLHALSIAHLDLKPGNLLIAAGNHVKISDLGLSRKKNEAGELFKGNVGTPGYNAPETRKFHESDSRFLSEGMNHISSVSILKFTIFLFCFKKYFEH